MRWMDLTFFFFFSRRAYCLRLPFNVNQLGRAEERFELPTRFFYMRIFFTCKLAIDIAWWRWWIQPQTIVSEWTEIRAVEGNKWEIARANAEWPP